MSPFHYSLFLSFSLLLVFLSGTHAAPITRKRAGLERMEVIVDLGQISPASVDSLPTLPMAIEKRSKHGDEMGDKRRKSKHKTNKGKEDDMKHVKAKKEKGKHKQKKEKMHKKKHGGKHSSSKSKHHDKKKKQPKDHKMSKSDKEMSPKKMMDVTSSATKEEDTRATAAKDENDASASPTSTLSTATPTSVDTLPASATLSSVQSVASPSFVSAGELQASPVIVSEYGTQASAPSAPVSPTAVSADQQSDESGSPTLAAEQAAQTSAAPVRPNYGPFAIFPFGLIITGSVLFVGTTVVLLGTYERYKSRQVYRHHRQLVANSATGLDSNPFHNRVEKAVVMRAMTIGRGPRSNHLLKPPAHLLQQQ
ncbi:uncharacterized protein VTP21DRAFT_6923 [Calcarisporiella thermophila]|uniref:uncharacterized protein n=1 Tax=Calcarisporiella thermophila TaxID=911321 RepID=UPI00374362F8